MDDELRLTDAWRLRALSHPMRLRILGSLRLDGPATSAILARRLDTDTGQTSFHLRQLARHGLVIEASDLGTGRERYWRASSASTVWDPAALTSDRDWEALTAFEAAVDAVYAEQVTRYRQTRHEWPEEWQEAAHSSGDYPIRTTAEGLSALVEELQEVIARHDLGPDAPGTELVTVLLHAFPARRDPR